MSEAERLRRQEYKRNRKKWILIQTIALLVAAVIALGSFIIYNKINDTYYIEYLENGTVDYKVELIDNEFFDKDSVDKNHSYLSSLTDSISATFNYALNMGADNVAFDYSYQIDAQLVIADKDSKLHIYEPTYSILPEQKSSVTSSNSVLISKNISIDYNTYNNKAIEFINRYNLKNITSNLIVTLKVDVTSKCDGFAEDAKNSYFISLNIPLNTEVYSVATSKTNPNAESHVLAYVGAENKTVALVLGIIFASLAAIAAIALVIFVFVTRNEDVTYTNKIRNILSTYRSFIQRIDGQFDTTGYQIVPIKTISEMLSIRDTLQSPLLMFENFDQTMTEFVIPTNTSILYTIVIKVDNYDEIYGIEPETDPIDEEIEEAVTAQQ